MKKSLLFLFGVLFCLQSQFVAAQSRAVTGKVTDAGGNGLPGVSVSVKSSTNGAITDGDGAYSVNVPSDKNTLVFSYIGFVSQEVVIGSRTQINVSLAEDATALSEVVVVGYGTQKKSQMTGAISQVSAKQITEMPLTNLGQALQGRAAGVDVSQSGSKPGSAPRILIRGRRSFNAGNDPLYVVDGIPLTRMTFSRWKFLKTQLLPQFMVLEVQTV
jgi:hypothetical protein